MSRSWTLADADERARQHPGTFLIPPRARRERLRVGEQVKLAFVGPGGAPGAERLWVKIHTVEPGRYAGTLQAAPFTLPGLERGDRVEFGPEHVIAINE
jgi:hypothetical protein